MENWIPRKRFYNSLFLWIEENGPRSCPWSFVSVVIAILFPLLTLQEQIHFDLYNLRNWNWNASKSFIVLKNDFSSEIPPSLHFMDEENGFRLLSAYFSIPHFKYSRSFYTSYFRITSQLIFELFCFFEHRTLRR